MQNTIRTLQQLKQLRERKISQLTTELAQQQQLCQRYQKNIQSLTELSDASCQLNANHAALMSNGSEYKNHLNRVINWQKQECALADKAVQMTQSQLVHQACKEKTISLVLDEQQKALQHQQNQREQKVIDGVSAQVWLRNKLAG